MTYQKVSNGFLRKAPGGLRCRKSCTVSLLEQYTEWIFTVGGLGDRFPFLTRPLVQTASYHAESTDEDML